MTVFWINKENYSVFDGKVIVVYLIILILLCGLVACREQGESAPKKGLDDVYLSPGDTLPPYDVYFTWQDYDPDKVKTLEAHEHALYIWCGKPVGRGKVGFTTVISKIRALPQRSKILMYPCYCFPMLGDNGLPHKSYPFVIYASTPFWDTLASQNMTLIYSPRDHQGQIHPQCMWAYELWKSTTSPGP